MPAYSIAIAQTHVHPLIALLALVAAAMICLLPRKHLLAPLLAATLLIPLDQIIVVAPLHWQIMRIVLLLAWVRVLATRPAGTRIFSGGLNPIDKAIILWTLSSAAAQILRWHSAAILVNQAGVIYTIFATYFLMRFLIRDHVDVEFAVRLLVGIAVLVAAVMVVEHSTGRNPYAYFGGAREAVRTELLERGQRFRAMGPFNHPILAGVFGATLAPLALGLWWRKRRAASTVGFVAATIIVLASVSSTPVLAYAAGLFGLWLWPFRRSLRPLRWGLVIALLGLHLLMKAPVWALIHRFNVIGGSSGYHRYVLVDEFIRHWGEWWLIGSKDYSKWGFLTADVANQYVNVGETTGLLPFILYISIFVYAFKCLGRALNGGAVDRHQQLFIWALGCALFTHVIAFFGITYFDQMVVAWYAFLAMISAAAVAPFREAAGACEADKSEKGRAPLPNSASPFFV